MFNNFKTNNATLYIYMDKIALNKTLVGKGEQAYIIAELSGNHGGNLDKAER